MSSHRGERVSVEEASFDDPSVFERLQSTSWRPSSDPYSRFQDGILPPHLGDLFSAHDQTHQESLHTTAPLLFSKTELFKSRSEIRTNTRRILPGAFVAARWIRLADADEGAPSKPAQLVRWARRQENVAGLPVFGQVSVAEIGKRASWFRERNSYLYGDYTFSLSSEDADDSLTAVADEGFRKYVADEAPTSESIDQSAIDSRIYDVRSSVKKLLDDREWKAQMRVAAVEMARQDVANAIRWAKEDVQDRLRAATAPAQRFVRRAASVPFTESPPGLLRSLLDPNAYGAWEDRREDHAWKHGSDFYTD